MTTTAAPGRSVLPLEGVWSFSPDPGSAGVREKWYARKLEDAVRLPGTTDENAKGERNDKIETNHLSRKWTYEGPAWYQTDVDIPREWAGKRIVFFMERTKSSTVWVDERRAGEGDSLTTPHEYDLTPFLTPGKHRLSVRIDNADHPSIGDPHQISNHTQTNWNGIVGRIELRATDRFWIDDAQVYAEPRENRVRVRLRIGNESGAEAAGRVTLSFAAANGDGGSDGGILPAEREIVCARGMQTFEIDCELKPEEVRLWDEFRPQLYRLTASLSARRGGAAFADALEAEFGVREFRAEGTQFAANGRTVFLRGKNDACVFPLTGYAPMDMEAWTRVFEIAKSYGINHYRFHTWCPPEAAFAAADRAGIYLQPELPFWYPLLEPGEEGYDPAVKAYLLREGERILAEYGNHPSFAMFALGNELIGSRRELMDLVRRFREFDSRHLYAEGSNNNYSTPDWAEGQDFWVTMRTGIGGFPVRGSFATANPPLGHVQVNEPSAAIDYRSSIERVQGPVVGHEIGQYQIYPNYREIDKYTGVLEPRNLREFRDRLERAGMADQADGFFRASGALAVACYREEIEAALRTPGFGGFQLLDLQDFPGQGTALVGILDAFLDSKGLIEPSEWRQFCEATVLLLTMEKYVWHTGETFKASFKIANYGESAVSGAVPEWALLDENGRELASGTLQSRNVPQGQLTTLGLIELDLRSFTAPAKRFVEIRLKGTSASFRNRYPLWIYPDRPGEWSAEGVHVRRKLDRAALDLLRQGEKVLLLPERNAIRERVEGTFASDFWNYSMFKSIAEAERMPVAPGTLGILCDPAHPALADFPTDSHADWQWGRLLPFAPSVILDRAPAGYRPIVQTIDNFGRNHKLGVLFEGKAGPGKLLVCTIDLPALRNKPEAKQLMASLLRYAQSDRFDPRTEWTEDLLGEWFAGSR
ncbi:sugar-binding domain-containing protein [Cohnella zeiphila]|uniref:Glycoside hydrolase family 2 n=1 Tax=Cohnella zeiphila TaxID=2761120 RepID=A0A7X0SQD1_9BACL|nr:sugar-binding domain-containing protein [Cohnella zeiphila]MBB6734203.1 glycoside hydrolase family 2 [Cohnella zeiphila]